MRFDLKFTFEFMLSFEFESLRLKKCMIYFRESELYVLLSERLTYANIIAQFFKFRII